METEKFARTIISKLLEGDDRRLACLRTQFSSATFSNVYGTGSGVKAIFDFSGDVELLENKNHICLADLDVNLKGLEYELISCVLHVKEGKLWYFEAASFVGDWVDEVGEFDMKFRNAEQRMIEW